eukprot:766027-Hanusia_phi.AAC.2
MDGNLSHERFVAHCCWTDSHELVRNFSRLPCPPPSSLFSLPSPALLPPPSLFSLPSPALLPPSSHFSLPSPLLPCNLLSPSSSLLALLLLSSFPLALLDPPAFSCSQPSRLSMSLPLHSLLQVLVVVNFCSEGSNGHVILPNEMYLLLLLPLLVLLALPPPPPPPTTTTTTTTTTHLPQELAARKQAAAELPLDFCQD